MEIISSGFDAVGWLSLYIVFLGLWFGSMLGYQLALVVLQAGVKWLKDFWQS